MEFQGKVVAATEVITSGNNNEFKKRVIRVEIEERYRGKKNINPLEFTFENDDLTKLDKLFNKDGQLIPGIEAKISGVWPLGFYYKKKDQQGNPTEEIAQSQILLAESCELAQ